VRTAANARHGGVSRARAAGRARPFLHLIAMSRRIDEIMNREVLAVLPETPAQAIRELLRTFAIRP